MNKTLDPDAVNRLNASLQRYQPRAEKLALAAAFRQLEQETAAEHLHNLHTEAQKEYKRNLRSYEHD